MLRVISWAGEVGSGPEMAAACGVGEYGVQVILGELGKERWKKEAEGSSLMRGETQAAFYIFLNFNENTV